MSCEFGDIGCEACPFRAARAVFDDMTESNVYYDEREGPVHQLAREEAWIGVENHIETLRPAISAVADTPHAPLDGLTCVTGDNVVDEVARALASVRY